MIAFKLIITKMSQYLIELFNQKYRDKIEQYLSKYIDITMPVWIISSGLFQKIKFQKISKKIAGYNITTLIISNNYYAPVIKDIGPSVFHYLLVLSLSNNAIQTVEQLVLFQTPYLEALYLDKNFLTNLKSLRKFIDKSLKILDVSMNQLVDITHIFQFNCPNIKQLSLYRNESATYFQPFIKSNINPPLLVLNKMGFKSQHAKKDFIDFCLRKPLNGEIAKTKI